MKQNRNPKNNLHGHFLRQCNANALLQSPNKTNILYGLTVINVNI